MCGNGVVIGTVQIIIKIVRLIIQRGAAAVRVVCCAVARGTTTPTSAAPLIGTTTHQITVATITASALPFSLAARYTFVASFELKRKKVLGEK